MLNDGLAAIEAIFAESMTSMSVKAARQAYRALCTTDLHPPPEVMGSGSSMAMIETTSLCCFAMLGRLLLATLPSKETKFLW